MMRRVCVLDVLNKAPVSISATDRSARRGAEVRGSEVLLDGSRGSNPNPPTLNAQVIPETQLRPHNLVALKKL